MKIIVNGKIILKDQIVSKNLFIDEDKIVEISDRKPTEGTIIDAQGLYVSPGFIDVHTHGRKGHDTMEGTLESLNGMSLEHLKTGVTGFLATTVTNPIEKTYRAVKNVALNKDKLEGAKVIGVHLEGPFINPVYKGAQPEASIIEPTIQNYNALVGLYGSIVKKITLAPEISHCLDLIKRLSDENISVSVGHTNATYDQTIKAFEAGANSTTHTYNAMTPLKHREPGVVGAVMNDQRAYAELILDGRHVVWPAAKTLVRLKDEDKMILVTDSLEAAGMPIGEYTLGGQRIFVKQGRAELSNGTIAGSIVGMNQEVRNAVRFLNIPLPTAVNFASRNPADSINEPLLGRLEVGCYADIILFDEDINVCHAFVNGVQKY